MASRAGKSPLQFRLKRIEVLQAIPGSLVAEIVGKARKAVDRQQMAARGLGQEPRRDREVLPLRLPHEVGRAEAAKRRIDRLL